MNGFLKMTMKRLGVYAVIMCMGYSAQASDIPPISAALSAKSGSSIITSDWLLNHLPGWDDDRFPIVSWINNDQLIYVLPGADGKLGTNTELFDLKTYTHEVLVEGASSVSSPDGQWIAFVKGRGEAKQVWVKRVNKSDEKQLSHVQGGLDYHGYFYSFIWSDDSKKIILAHQLEHYPWEPGPMPLSIIEYIDISTEQTKQLAALDASIHYLSWLPNTHEILFVKERISGRYDDPIDREWIQAVDTENGKIRTLLQLDSLQQGLKPTASSDGKTVALLYDADNPIFDFMLSIGLIPATANCDKGIITPTRLTHELKLSGIRWAKDSKTLYSLRRYGAYEQLVQIDATTGEAIQLTNEPADIATYSVSPDGKQLAWISKNAHDELALKTAFIDGSKVHTLLTVKRYPQDMALSEVREIDWETVDYPTHMRGILVMPLGYIEGNRYPLIVDIHGGDMGASLSMLFAGSLLLNTPLEWQLWAAKGYAVFAPEMRSSANFGTLAISRDILQDHDQFRALH